jgi:hypothetical protein
MFILSKPRGRAEGNRVAASALRLPLAMLSMYQESVKETFAHCVATALRDKDPDGKKQ